MYLHKNKARKREETQVKNKQFSVCTFIQLVYKNELPYNSQNL